MKVLFVLAQLWTSAICRLAALSKILLVARRLLLFCALHWLQRCKYLFNWKF